MQNRGNTKKAVFAAVGIGLAVILALSFLLFHGKDAPDNGNGRGLVVSADASDWDKNLEDRSGEASGIKIPGYGELTIGKDAGEFQMSLVNPEGNPCYFKYTLEIPETSEVLYDSDLIEPGKAITKFAVENLPEKGDYDLYINISTYSLDGSLESMNGAQVKTILHVV